MRPPVSPVRRFDYAVAAAFAVGLAALYFGFRTDVHSYDAVVYATAADAPSAASFLHQNHLLFGPATWLWLKLWRLAGYRGSSVTALAAFSSCVAGAATAVFYLALRRLDVARATAAATVGAAAVTASWWFLAGEAELLSTITFFIAGALWQLAAPRMSARRGVALGVWLAAATWFHVTLVLFVPVAAVLVAGEREGRGRRLAALLVPYAFLAYAPYCVVGRWYYGNVGRESFVDWFAYYMLSRGCGVAAADGLVRGVLAWWGSLVAPTGNLYADFAAFRGGAWWAAFGPGLAVAAALAAAVVARGPYLWRERRRWLVAGAVWFVLYQLFFSWWEPTNPEWWLATALPWWLLAALAWPRRRAWAAALAVAAVAIGVLNFNRLIYPAYARFREPMVATAAMVVAASRPGDGVLASYPPLRIWVDNESRHTRHLAGAADATEWPGFATLVERMARGRVPPGRGIYFTDAELDSPAAATARDGGRGRWALWTMLMNATPVAEVPGVEGDDVLVRFERVRRPLAPVAWLEAEGDQPEAVYVCLSYTGAAREFRFDVPEAGTYTLALQARGTPACGEWPKLVVALDGRAFPPFAVEGKTWAFYELDAPLAPGPHRFTATFVDDFADEKTGENRDVFLNRLVAYRPR
jgi:hypothetical protein